MTTLINIRNDRTAINTVQTTNRATIRSALPCGAPRHLAMIWSVEPVSGRPVARWESAGESTGEPQNDAGPWPLLRPPWRSREHRHERRI